MRTDEPGKTFDGTANATSDGMTLSNAERASIILHEYDGLRAALRSRNSETFQVIAVVGGLFVYALGRDILDGRAWLAVIAAAVLVASAYAWLQYDTSRMARRLRQIEEQVNALAGTELLQWERRWGWGAKSYGLEPIPKALADAQARDDG
jgi:hypothetical protein